MGNLATLKNFKKKDPITGEIDPRIGQKPKGATSISTEMKRLLAIETKFPDEEGIIKKMPISRQLAITAVQKAKRGDSRLLEILLDRSEGKVVQPVENLNKLDLTDAAQERLEQLLGKLKDV